MSKKIINANKARENLYQLLKDVNENYSEIIITSERNENDAVLVSKKNWDGAKETLLLEQTGTLREVRKREADNSGFTHVDKIDWSSF